MSPHQVTITYTPWPGHEIPYMIKGTCQCGFTTGNNAFKWVALMIQ